MAFVAGGAHGIVHRRDGKRAVCGRCRPALRAEERDAVAEARRKALYDQYFKDEKEVDELELYEVVEEEERLDEERERDSVLLPAQSVKQAVNSYFEKEEETETEVWLDDDETGGSDPDGYAKSTFIESTDDDDDDVEVDDDEFQYDDQFDEESDKILAQRSIARRGPEEDDDDLVTNPFGEAIDLLPVNSPTEVLEKRLKEGLKPMQRLDLTSLALIAGFTAAGKPDKVVQLLRPMNTTLRALGLEAVLQCVAFSGYPKVLVTFMILRENGLIPDELVLEDPFVVREIAFTGYKVMGRSFNRGTRKMRERLQSYHPDLYTWMNQFVYGRVMGREGLTPREREVCAAAALCGQDIPAQLAQHIRSAVRAGVSKQEIAEVLSTMDQVWGLPAQRQALSILELMRRNRL